MTTEPAPAAAPRTTAALVSPLFRRMWVGGLMFNLGVMVLGVSSGWAMTQMTTSPTLVALVQTSLTVPIMLFALPAGAIADMYDRRVIALIALGIGIASSAALAVASFFGVVTPAVLLVFAFLVGCGMSLSAPASQSAIAEQVPPEHLPSAVALNSIAMNLARSFGPAVGGLIVAATSPLSGFAITTILLVPMFVAFFRWQRAPVTARLPPERIGRAMLSGIRYVALTAPVRAVLIRTTAAGLAYGSLVALMPLTSRDLLGGGAGTYGLLLGAFGVGAVIGALNIGYIRARFSAQWTVALCTVMTGAAMIGVGVSRSMILDLLILFVGGAFWTTMTALLNISIQLSAPRWVAGRCLAAFSAAVAGSVGVGAWFWGDFASTHGVASTLVVSGMAMMATVLIGLVIPAPTVREAVGPDGDLLPDPKVKLALTARSGPVVVEIGYRVPLDQARSFYRALQKVQPVRQRNGGYGWSVARDIAEPELWVERFHCPTWLDYLHQRNRATAEDRALDEALAEFHGGSDGIVIRRMLERPFGSVRWQDDAPDPASAPTTRASPMIPGA